MIKKFMKGAALVAPLAVAGLSQAHAALDTSAVEAVGTDAGTLGPVAFTALGVVLAIFIGMKLVKKGANKAS